jgi:hypothetical protein
VPQVRVDRVRGDVQLLGDLTVRRALDNRPDDRELGCGQLRPLRGGRIRAPACPLDAAVAELPADTRGVPFRACGGVQPERLIQVADRLVLRPVREQPAGILKRRRADQRSRVAAVGLDSSHGSFGIIINKCACVESGWAHPGKAWIHVRITLQQRGDGDGVLPLPCGQQQSHQLDRV